MMSTSRITTIGSRYRRLIFALSLAAVANAGCSQAEPTKDELLSRANAAFAAGQYDKAEKEYREVLRLAPDDPAALRQLGIIYLDQGQIVQAYPLLKKSAELQPDDPEIQLKLGQLSLAAGDYTQARDTASQILEKQPGHEQALLLLADASRKPDDIEDARKLVQSLREKDQDHPRYHLALGTLDLRQNDPARAESEFKAALNLDPKSSDAYAALGSPLLEPQRSQRSGPSFQDGCRSRSTAIADTAAICGFLASRPEPPPRQKIFWKI